MTRGQNGATPWEQGYCHTALGILHLLGFHWHYTCKFLVRLRLVEVKKKNSFFILFCFFSFFFLLSFWKLVVCQPGILKNGGLEISYFEKRLFKHEYFLENEFPHVTKYWNKSKNRQFGTQNEIWTFDDDQICEKMNFWWWPDLRNKKMNFFDDYQICKIKMNFWWWPDLWNEK